MTKEKQTQDAARCWAPSRRDYLANALSEITSMNCQAAREGKKDLLLISSPVKKGGVKGTPDDIGFAKSPKMRQASVQRQEAAFQYLKQTRVKPSCKERKCSMRQTAIEDFFQRKIPIPCLLPTNRFIHKNLQRDKEHAVRSELGYFHAIARCSLEGMYELKMAMQPRVTLQDKSEGPEGDEMGKHFEAEEILSGAVSVKEQINENESLFNTLVALEHELSTQTDQETELVPQNLFPCKNKLMEQEDREPEIEIAVTSPTSQDGGDKARHDEGAARFGRKVFRVGQELENNCNSETIWIAENLEAGESGRGRTSGAACVSAAEFAAAANRASSGNAKPRHMSRFMPTSGRNLFFSSRIPLLAQASLLKPRPIKRKFLLQPPCAKAPPSADYHGQCYLWTPVYLLSSDMSLSLWEDRIDSQDDALGSAREVEYFVS